MKAKNYLVAIGLVIFLLVGLNNGANYNVKASSNGEPTTLSDIERAKKESVAMDLAVEIKEIFEDDEYGGMYLDDNQILHVKILSSNTNNDLKRVAEKISVEVKYLTEKSQYSLHDLKRAQEILTDLLFKHEANFSEVYLDEKVNRVIVDLLDSEEYPVEILNILERDIYIKNYSKESIKAVNEVAVGPGYATKSCTIAFMAKRNGNLGFVTAGHCVGGVGTSLYNPNNVKMGTTEIKFDGGNIDAAFIRRTNSVFTPTSIAKQSGKTIHGFNDSFIIQGVTINLEGKTSGHRTGTITSTSSTVSSGTTKRIKASYYSQGGDSGGTMWVGRYISGTNIWSQSIVGVHNGSYLLSGVRQGAYGTRINYVISSLGVSYAQ